MSQALKPNQYPFSVGPPSRSSHPAALPVLPPADRATPPPPHLRRAAAAATVRSVLRVPHLRPARHHLPQRRARRVPQGKTRICSPHRFIIPFLHSHTTPTFCSLDIICEQPSHLQDGVRLPPLGRHRAVQVHHGHVPEVRQEAAVMARHTVSLLCFATPDLRQNPRNEYGFVWISMDL